MLGSVDTGQLWEELGYGCYVNPGYSLKHGRARTVNDNAALERQKHNWRKLSESELNHIRSESRLKWLAAWEDPGKPVVKSVYDWESTYSRQHDFKKLDQPTESRPTSPTRRNNPHPPGIFLRLHVLKDSVFPSSHAKPGRNPYEGKYVYDSSPIPDGTMYYTPKDVQRLKREGQTEILKKIMNPEKMSGRKINPKSFQSNQNGSFNPEISKGNCEQEVVPSQHRWLKCAGKEEREKISNVKKNLWLQRSRNKTVDPNRYRLFTYDSSPQVKTHRPYRKELGIHPELWTK